MPRSRPLIALAFGALCAAACQGSIDASTGSAVPPVEPDGTPAKPGDKPSPPGKLPDGGKPMSGNMPPVGDQTGAGPRPLRGLTQLEYNNTIRDLLGDQSAPNTLGGDAAGEWGYLFAPVVTTANAQSLLELAERAAGAAVAKLDGLQRCDTAALGEAACAHAFITDFGKRVFRRPVDKADVDELDKLYADIRKLGDDHAAGIRAVLSAMLQWPQFLYQWQRPAGAVDAKGDLVKLDAYELASRLSYFLWSSMPDDKLFAAADAGALLTADGLKAEVTRMLKDPKAQDTVAPSTSSGSI